jgi:O-antigen/teichoic acid export membrane protein
VEGEKSVMSYVTALYVSYSTGVVISFIALLYRERNLRIYNLSKVIKDVFHFGFVTSVANLFHIGNKRVGYYFIRFFTGLSSLGIYTAGSQLTEGLKLIGQSISLVQFTTLSNSTDTDYAKNLTVKLMKVSVLLTFLALVVLFIIPVSVYVLLFGPDFFQVKSVIMFLSPGVIALSANTVFAHFFSGTGNPKINLYSNAIGFFVVLVLVLILIPVYGFMGAAIAVSVSYLVSLIYNYIRFKAQTGVVFKELMPGMSDIVEFRSLLKKPEV